MNTPPNTKLALRNISRRFGSVGAVQDVTFDLPPGEFVALLGPSGCGKTTTLRMIAGFIKPSEGTIEMDGEVLSSAQTVRPPERRKMSMIFQSYAVWPHMTVRDNVAFGLTLRPLSASTVRDKVERILDIVRLRMLADRYPSELSGGQQQRVALARAMVVEPEVLLLDEPLSNLDANLREEMRFEIRRLHDEFRITTIYVTHDQAEAMVTSDRIVVMNNGRVEQIDPPYVLYNRPKTKFVAGFIGRTNFLEGKIESGAVRFDGFEIKTDMLALPRQLRGSVTLSIRPQSIALSDSVPQSEDRRWSIEGVVAQRAYLGEFWDYFVTPAHGAATLRVTAPPASVIEIGQRVWLSIDPAQIVCLS